jgi:hypothetical protein
MHKQWAELAYANASLGSDLGVAVRAKVLPRPGLLLQELSKLIPNLPRRIPFLLG